MDVLVKEVLVISGTTPVVVVNGAGGILYWLQEYGRTDQTLDGTVIYHSHFKGQSTSPFQFYRA
jgi:hypothetical protein